MPPSSLTMVGLAPSGKPTQPTTHPPRANTTPLASNDIQQSISKQRFNTFSDFGNYTKFSTHSYVEPHTKTPPPKVITQQTHHDGTPHHTSNQTNLQKKQSPREQHISLSYSKSLQQAKPNAQPSPYPHSDNRNLNDHSNRKVISLPTPYHLPNMRKCHSSKPLEPPNTPMRLPTITQTMSQPNHNCFWFPPLADKPYQAPVTNNKTPSKQPLAIPALPTATNNRCMMPPMNQRNAITT